MGSQRQGEARTVQGELERAVEEVFQQPISIYLAGRTDRGVHAAGQVATFADPKPAMANDTVVAAINDKLPADLAVGSCERMPMGFHARYAAVSREYRYRIWAGNRQPLAEPYVMRVRKLLDVDAMNAACGLFVGDNDFASVASGGEGVPHRRLELEDRRTIRTVFECSTRVIPNWWGATGQDGHLYEVRVVANGFLPRMVRGIVGVVIEVGRGHWSLKDVANLMEARDRRKGPMNAPAQGLSLWSVQYDDD